MLFDVVFAVGIQKLIFTISTNNFGQVGVDAFVFAPKAARVKNLNRWIGIYNYQTLFLIIFVINYLHRLPLAVNLTNDK
jgi:hypothetical protein